jgi:hypothetical protein
MRLSSRALANSGGAGGLGPGGTGRTTNSSNVDDLERWIYSALTWITVTELPGKVW